MAFLHSKSICHRDLKSNNVLMGHDGTAKVSDFGLSRHASDTSMTHEVGTPLWAAPEVFMGLPYDLSCDVFSFAITLLELAGLSWPPCSFPRALADT